MNYEEFIELYKPIKNHINLNAAFDGFMFETFGNELNFVKSNISNRIWTIIDSNGILYLVPGYHFINRLGYIITKVSYDGDFIEINLDDD